MTKTILITGSSSALGRDLLNHFFLQNACIYTSATTPESHRIQSTLTDFPSSFDYVLCFHGLNILGMCVNEKKMSAAAKANINSTQEIVNQLIRQNRAPKCVLCASSTFIYGNGAKKASVESSPPGTGFTAKYFGELEATLAPLSELGSRVVIPRLATVISRQEPPDLPHLPFPERTLARTRGSSLKPTSWISHEDALGAILFLIEEQSICGPVNICSGDNPCKKALFKKIAKFHSLNAWPPLPKKLVQLIWGKASADFLDTSAMALPIALLKNNFLFQNISMDEYLGRGPKKF